MHRARFDLTGVAYDEEQAQHILVVEGALGNEAVLADEVTMVGGKDHQGIAASPRRSRASRMRPIW